MKFLHTCTFAAIATTAVVTKSLLGFLSPHSEKQNKNEKQISMHNIAKTQSSELTCITCQSTFGKTVALAILTFHSYQMASIDNHNN